MVNERIEEIKTRLHNILLNLDEEHNRIFEDYLFKRGHLDRLIYMLDSLLPYCNRDTHLVDMGSNVVFPYLVKLIAEVKECEGLSIMPFHGETVTIKDDYTIQFEPLKDFPFSQDETENSISIPIINCNLSKDRLPYKNHSVDVLTCFETLEHLRSDPMNLFVEANRVIKDDGFFVLTTPNANSMNNIKRILNYESPNFYPPFIRDQDAIEHVKEYSINEIKLLFDSAGFEIIELRTFNHFDSKEFNHYEAYQINYVQEDETKLEELRRNDDRLGKQIAELLSNIDGLDQYRGDYIHVVAKRSSSVNNRYCFPIYEK
jgi:SAM-dependent methyltransferase